MPRAITSRVTTACLALDAVPAPATVLAPGHVTTTRLTLRPWRESDRSEFTRVYGLTRDLLARTVPLGRATDSADAIFDRQLMLCEEGDRRGTAWRRPAFLADGRLAGAFNLTSIERGLKFCGVASWWLSSDQLHHGYAVEGVLAMLDHAFTDLPRGLGLNEILAHVLPDNEPSTRTAERAGFQPTGSKTSVLLGGGWVSHTEFRCVPHARA